MNDAVATEAEGKKSRSDGLVKATFANDKGTDHKRVPEGVNAVVLNGKQYVLSSIPQGIKDQLVAFALAQRAKTYVNNHADDEKNGSDVPELIEKVYSDMLAGKLYAVTAEGGAKKGKEYDPTDIIEAVRRAKEKVAKTDPSKQPASEAQLAALRDKLMGLQGKDRTAFVLKLQQDPLIGPFYQAIKAAKRVAAYNAEKDKKVSVMEDLF